MTDAIKHAKIKADKLADNPVPNPVPASLDVNAAKIQEAIAASKASSSAEASALASDLDAIADKDGELLYQTYTCSRTSTQMVSDKGRKVRFSNFLFITKDEALIEYLDAQITLGLRDVTKGDKVATDSRDPMAAVRAKHYKEFLVLQKAAKAKEGSRDMGATDNAANIKALSTSNKVV